MDSEHDIKKSTQRRLTNDKWGTLMSPVQLSMLILFFILIKGYQHANIIVAVIFCLLIFIQFVVVHIPKYKENSLFISGGPFPLIIYNVAMVIAFTFYVPLYSPLLFIFAGIIFITVYFRGPLVMWIEIINIGAVALFSYLHNGLPNATYAKIYPVMFTILGATFAVIVQRAGSIDNQIRNDLIEASGRITQERERLNGLLNGIQDSVVATDENGNIIFYNSASLKLLEAASIEIGEPFSKLVRLFDDKSNLIDFFSLISNNNSTVKNLSLTGKNHQDISVSIDISRVHSSVDIKVVQGIIFLIRDITKEKSLDEERDEFAAVTSHELRTPIATAEANVSLAMTPKFMEGLSESSKDRLQKAHQSILYLSDLINQLAELSYMEGNNPQKNYSTVKPDVIVNEIFNEFKPSAEDRKLKLTVNIEKGLEPIYTNKIYLTEMLQNFVSNAIKYTKEGSVVISVGMSREVEDNIVFSVADTGTGISSADQKRIFRKFYRAEDYRTRETRGTGLGLYLTLKQAHNLNGRIWFNSEINKGSTFYLQIPTNKKPLKESSSLTVTGAEPLKS